MPSQSIPSEAKAGITLSVTPPIPASDEPRDEASIAAELQAAMMDDDDDDKPLRKPEPVAKDVKVVESPAPASTTTMPAAVVSSEPPASNPITQPSTTAPPTPSSSNTLVPPTPSTPAPASATSSTSAATPSPRRPRNLKPKKGILKPPPPPIKAGLSGKLRDALGSIHPKFYDYTAPLQNSEWGAGVGVGGGNGGIAGTGIGAGMGERLADSGAVASVANNVIGVGEVVGGAAAAMVGSLGGKLGRFMGGAAGKRIEGASAGLTAQMQSPASPSPHGSAPGTPTSASAPSPNPPSNTSTFSPLLPSQLAALSSPLRTSSANPAQSPSTPTPSPLRSLAAASSPLNLSTTKPLKRATFILPLMSVTYPISASQAPYSDKVLTERAQIEKDKNEEIGRCTGEGWWTRERLVGLYEAACYGREEGVRIAIREGLIAAAPPSNTSPPSPTPPRQLLLTSSLLQTPSSTLHSQPANARTYHVVEPPLGKYAAEALADVLRVEWGLKKLVLEGGIIDGDESLKPILHALLVSGTLPTLSLAGNKKIKPPGWRVAAQYIRKAKTLRYIDISDNILDKRSVEYLVQALTPGPATLPDEPENAEDLELKTMDEPAEAGDKEDDEPPMEKRPGVQMPSAPLLREDSLSDSGRASVQTLRMDNCSLRAGSLEVLGQGIRHSDIKNLSLRKNKINALGAVAIAIMVRDFPDTLSSMTTAGAAPGAQASSGAAAKLSVITNSSSLDPGARAAALADASSDDLVAGLGQVKLSEKEKEKGEAPDLSKASAALQEKVKLLENVERLGSLVTLDVKSNDIRGGVSYIAQVLKRNRTLKVLNISDNRIDASGLAAIADALKYNTTLETLDISQNPCCGPSNEGISVIRSMLTVNTTLKRLFLSSTGLTTEGAIALAEVVPDCRGVIHLDLTNNPGVELAGVMAISVALRSNRSMRCLDLTVPLNDPQMAELSQSILQSCIRNTEAAAATKGEKAAPAALWAPIQKSALVRQAKEAEQAKAFAETQKAAITPAGHARQKVYKLKPDTVIKACEETAEQLMQYIEAGVDRVFDETHAQEEALLIEKSKALMERVADLIQDTDSAQKLERLLSLNDLLLPQTSQAEELLESRKRAAKERARSAAPPRVEVLTSGSPARPIIPQAQNRRHIRVASLELTSPNFSITNSDDDDSDAEELSASVPTPVVMSHSQFGKGSATAGYPSNKLTLDGIGLTGKRNDTLNASPMIQEPEECSSPLKEVNRDWIAEEGEIFRKGAALGVADEDEGEEDADVSGQDLKQKILDTDVERTPHAPIPEDSSLGLDVQQDEI